MDHSWLEARIEATKATIEAYETAITGLSGGTIDSFSLDTGQTRQVVTRKNMSVLQSALNSAYNLLSILEARRYGAGVQARPQW